MALVESKAPFSIEFRVKFPGPTNTVMPATQLSGALLSLYTSSLAAGAISLWYEKPALTSMTGNVYLTSSAGRLQLTSASLFDDHFYNLSIVKEAATGSLTLCASSYEDSGFRFLSSSRVYSGSVGFPFESRYSNFTLGLSGSTGEFWGQEARLWTSALTTTELHAHAEHFESYGRDVSYNNKDLLFHWRLNDGVTADAGGHVYVMDSTPNNVVGTGSFVPGVFPFVKFLEDYSYIPSIDYGWNQDKVRIYDGSSIDTLDQYHDERFVSLEFNMYDALNEDISHMLSSYDELNNVMGHPMNRYREDYEGLAQMRETYFKRLQGQLSLKVFVNMLDFFDSTFVSIVERLLPARSLFKGDEIVVESHMLERPKYQYQIRPFREPPVDISGSICITVSWGDIGR